MNTTQTISTILFLTFVPALVACWEDRFGDKHPNKDWMFLGALMIIFSTYAMIGNASWWQFIRNLCVSFFGYSLVFPLMMNWVHYKKKVITAKNWWSHLSPTAWPDRLALQFDMGWATRLLIYAGLYVIAVLFWIVNEY